MSRRRIVVDDDGELARIDQLAHQFAKGQLPEQNGRAPRHAFCVRCDGRGYHKDNTSSGTTEVAALCPTAVFNRLEYALAALPTVTPAAVRSLLDADKSPRRRARKR